MSATGAPTTFTKKALLEDFTGTWCSQCPPAGAAVTNAVNGNSNIFGVGYHASSSSTQEPMEIPETAYWSDYYNVTGFPTLYVNGPDTRWNFPGYGTSQCRIGGGSNCWFGSAGSYCRREIRFRGQSWVQIDSLLKKVKLMVYLAEDNVTTSTPQEGSSDGANYVHRDVLREVYTGQLGDVHC